MTEKIILGPSGPPITTSVSGTDYLNVWKSGALQQITKANFMGATLTGAGTLATGGFTLTVPATGTAALRGVAQSFTDTQTFAPTSTSVAAVAVNAPASCSTPIQTWSYNSVRRSYIVATATASNIGLDFGDFGSLVVGPSVVIGGNNNGTNACSGTLNIPDRAGTSRYMWPDQSGNLRIHTSAPTNFTTDTNGTVVGTQTSMAEAKNISDVLPDPVEALRNVVKAAKEGLRAWSYKSGSFNNEQFPNGLVTDLAPRYGMDRDEAHPAGKSLNIPVAIGDLFAAVALIANHLGINLEDK